MPRATLTIITFIAVLVLSSAAAIAAPSSQPSSSWQDKVDPWVLQTGADGPTEFLVFMADQADVQPAANLRTKADRGEFVYRTLSQHAEQTQGPVRRRLAELGVQYQPYWVANMIWVRGALNIVQILAQRADVAHIYANPTVKLDTPDLGTASEAAPSQPDAVEWNITKVNAPQVWSAGVNGAGAVIAGQDTGYRWTHSALKGKYRGWNGTTANHDYNWHDAIHSSMGACIGNSTEPCDDQGHGTHTMGTMVGDDGAGNQVGVAPGAKWIGCRNMDQGNGTPVTYSECYQWFVAPTKIDGTSPDPSKAPDVINNSWGCPPSEGCTDPNVLLTVVRNVTAAGIVTVHSAGNSGAGCSTVTDPAAIYYESFTVGATDENDNIAGFSSRGPVTVDGSNRTKPNVSAPGTNTALNKDIRSSYYSSDNAYTQMQGTSMAGPHVAGLVALMISANPGLRGSVDGIRSMIEQSAAHQTSTQGCGGDSPTAVPNNVFGWGRIDANAAYLQAMACTAPSAVTDLSIVRLDATQVKLIWGAKVGAGAYRVWWNGSPYFAPGIVCAVSSCTATTTTSFTRAALGDTTDNDTYLVEPEAACGSVQSEPSNRVGEFEFGLVR